VERQVEKNDLEFPARSYYLLLYYITSNTLKQTFPISFSQHWCPVNAHLHRGKTAAFWRSVPLLRPPRVERSRSSLCPSDRNYHMGQSLKSKLCPRARLDRRVTNAVFLIQLTPQQINRQKQTPQPKPYHQATRQFSHRLLLHKLF